MSRWIQGIVEALSTGLSGMVVPSLVEQVELLSSVSLFLSRLAYPPLPKRFRMRTNMSLHKLSSKVPPSGQVGILFKVVFLHFWLKLAIWSFSRRFLMMSTCSAVPLALALNGAQVGIFLARARNGMVQVGTCRPGAAPEYFQWRGTGGSSRELGGNPIK